MSLLSDPGLRAQQREVRGDGLLDFLSGKVAFHGREDVLAELIAFCEDSEKNWCWLALTGAGGSGKSRLAFKLCLRLHQRGWEAFFLDRSALDSTPPAALSTAPTDSLIVVDYVSFTPDRVATWLSRLPVNPARRIRVLMVEREGWPTTDLNFRAPAWYRDMEDAWKSADLRQHHYELPSGRVDVALAEHPLSATDFDGILTSINPADTIPAHVRREIITRLQTVIDPSAQRPLFLLFLASAYLDDPSDARWQTWNTAALHDVIYQRERRRLVHLVPEGFHDVALDLWAFATATQAPIVDIYRDAPDWLRVPLVDQPWQIRRQVQDALRAACGDTELDVRPYTPDIPGEYMVLARFSDWRDAERKSFVDTAWSQFPEGFGTFLTRALSDIDPASAVARESLHSAGLLAIPNSERDALTLARALEPLIDPAKPRPDIQALLTASADRFRSSAQLATRAVRAIVACSNPEPALQPRPEEPVDWSEAVRRAFPGLNVARQQDLAWTLRPVLELWVGEVLCLGLTTAELEEFEALGDSARVDWLHLHVPGYRAVTLRCLAALLSAAAAVATGMPWIAFDGPFADLLGDALPWSPLVVDETMRPILLAQSLFNLTCKPDITTAETRHITTLTKLAETHPNNPNINLRSVAAVVVYALKPDFDPGETAPVLHQLNRRIGGLDHLDPVGCTVDYLRKFLDGEDVTRLPEMRAAVVELGEDEPLSRVLAALL